MIPVVIGRVLRKPWPAHAANLAGARGRCQTVWGPASFMATTLPSLPGWEARPSRTGR
jgi:hypothetical protein